MAKRDFEIDLRMKADFASAQRALRETQGDIDNIGKATARANAEIASIGKGPAAAANPIAGTAADQEAGATDALNASLTQNAQSRQAVAAASRATQQAITAEIGLIGELQARLDRGAGSYDDLADTEAKLDVAMQKGLISAEEYEDALEQLNAEQARLDRQTEQTGKTIDSTIGRYDKAGAGLKRLQVDETRLKAAVDAGRISREQYNRALSGISTERARLMALRDGAANTANAMRGLNLQSLQAQQNIAQLVRFGVTGQWQAAGTQLLSLGNRAGAVGGLFSIAGLAIGATSATIVGLGVAAAAGYLQLRAIDTALIATGNSAGVTAGEIADMRAEIGEATGEFGDSQTAMVALAGSGAIASGSLEAAGRAAVNLSLLTKRSIEDTTAQIVALAKAPAATLLELNDRYHFLTQAVYDNVKALEDEGRAQEAAEVATEALSDVLNKRVEEMRERAGLLERKWYDVAKAIGSAIQRAKDYGREDPEGKLLAVQRELTRLERLPFPDKFSARQARIRELREQVGLAQDLVDKGKLQAAEDKEQSARVAAGVKAQASLQRDLEANADREAQKKRELIELERELAAVRTTGATSIAGQTLAAVEAQRRAQIEEKFKPTEARTRKGPKAQDPDEGARRELANLKQQIALLGDVENGEVRVSEAARIRYEIENDAYKGASAGVKKQLLEQAELLDSERRKIELAKQLKSVNLEILKQQGQDAAAALEEAANALRQVRAEAERQGSTEGVAQVDKLIGLTQARAELDQLERQYDTVTNEVQRKLQRISAERDAGLVTEIEAQRHIVQAYRDQGVELDVLLPKMEALAAQIGNPELVENVRRMRAEFEQTKLHVDLLQQQVGNIFKGAFSSALQSLTDRTKSLGQAVRGFFADMARGIAQLAANNLAEAAWSKLLKVFNKGDSADLKGSAQALSQSAIPLMVAAARLKAAATALAAAGTGGAGGTGAGGAGGLLTSALGFLGGFFADGGHVRGPGTGTSDSITARLSDGEFVSRAAVVAQPGALAFLSDFNRRGMAALPDWEALARHAPTINRHASPRYNFADGGPVQAAASLIPPTLVRVLNVLDKEDLSRSVAASRHHESSVQNDLLNNAGLIREIASGRAA